MKLYISDNCTITTDRDSVRKDHGNESLEISITEESGRMLIRFYDEKDAIKMARTILDRMGEQHPKRPKP